jgi:hypothetical protein
MGERFNDELTFKDSTRHETDNKDGDMEPENKPQNENILSFDQWKKTLEQTRPGVALQNYLKVLSFHDLVNEYKHVLEALEREPLNPELTKSAKSILREFSDRLGEHSIEHSDSLTALRKKLENRIFNLNGLL